MTRHQNLDANQACRLCGLSEDEHHEFSSLDMPPGCVCDPGTWTAQTVKPVCQVFIGEDSSYCATCEHDKACHQLQEVRT